MPGSYGEALSQVQGGGGNPSESDSGSVVPRSVMRDARAMVEVGVGLKKTENWTENIIGGGT